MDGRDCRSEADKQQRWRESDGKRQLWLWTGFTQYITTDRVEICGRDRLQATSKPACCVLYYAVARREAIQGGPLGGPE